MVIAANGLRILARKRAFLFLMILAWMPVVVRGVQIWAAANVPGMAQMGMLAVTPRMFRDFLNQQEPLIFFITVYAGSGLIADDIRAKALQLYLSRPVTRTQYIAGKAAILMASLAAVTWLPAMLLLFLVPAFMGSMAFVRDNLSLIPSISAVRGGQDHAVDVPDPGALVAEQQPLVRGRDVRGHRVLYARRLWRHRGRRRQHDVLVGVDFLPTSTRSATSCSACRRAMTRRRSCRRPSSASSSRSRPSS